MMKRFKAQNYQQQLFHLPARSGAQKRRRVSSLVRLNQDEAEAVARVSAEPYRLIEACNRIETVGDRDDWGRARGRPEQSGRLRDTIEILRADVIAKLNHPVGQSKQYFIDFMAIYGFSIEIEDEWPPFEADVRGAEDQLWEAPAGTMIDAEGNLRQDW